MDWLNLLNSLIPVLGEEAVKALSDELETISADKKGWKADVLVMLSKAVEDHGPEGITIAMEAINRMLKQEQPDISKLDLLSASNLLAHLQNAEADQKKAINDFLAKVSKVLSAIVSALLRGLVA